MLEDEQSFKHGGDGYSSTMLLKSSEEHKNEE
jgi:hypothetical protein